MGARMSKTILLADDSVTIQKVIELTFMDQDYEVVAVSNGDEALEKLASIEPDLVIADVHMPGASGYEVARRAKDQRSEVPVLLLVGTFEPFDKDEMTASGADSHLKKPFDSQELLQLVERLMATGAEGSASPAPEAELGGAEEEEGADEVTWSNLDLESVEMEAVEMEAEELDTPALGGPEAEEVPVSASPAAGDDAPFELPPIAEDTSWPPAQPQGASEPAAVEPTAAEPVAEPFRLGDEDEGFELVEETSEEEASWDAAEDEETPAVSDTGEGEKPPVAVLGFRPPAEEHTPEPTVEPELADEVEPTFETEDAAAVPAGVSTGEAAALRDEDVERIARRVAELLGDRVVREVAWEVIPDLAEVAIKARITELEEQVE